MEGVHHYLMKLQEPLKSTIELGGEQIYIDPTFDQTRYSNREGEVVGVPFRKRDGDVQVGDRVLIVHTMLMTQNYNGVVSDSPHLVDKKEGLWLLPQDMIVMYKKPGGQWIAHQDNLMVKPIKMEQPEMKTKGGLFIPDTAKQTDIDCNTHGFLKQYGHIRYANPELLLSGAKIGDRVYFKDYGNYEYNLDGEVLYCMDNRDVLAVIKE